MNKTKIDIDFLLVKKLKQTRSIIFTMIMLVILLSGCENNLNKEAKESEKIRSTELSNTPNAKRGYGEIAYNYLEYIQESLPDRIAFSQKEKDTATFIIDTLLDAGYPSGSINVQNFSFDGIIALPKDTESDQKSGNTERVSQNVIVTKEGDSNKTIIVGAHYDSVETHGIDDNGAGVAVVLESAMRMIDEQTPYTIQYVFFGAEERGLIGSGKYLSSLSVEEKENIVTMINIDTILGSDTCFIYGGSMNDDGVVENDWAVLKAYEYVEHLGLDIHLPNKNYGSYPTGINVASDHYPFLSNGIPYILFLSGFDGEQMIEEDFIPHSPNDNLDIINSMYPNRINKALESYSILLEHILMNIKHATNS